MHECNFAFYSDVGGRGDNEDSYIAKQINNNYLFVVADGLGGHGDGEIASRATVDTIKEFFMNNGDSDVVSAVELANKVVIEKQYLLNSKMKSTVAVAYVTQDKTYLAHIGDTRIYAFKENSVVYQSVDHSASQLAVFAGEITTSQIREHADRNILLRALGASENAKVDINEIDNSEYDALLLCSDGFWEYVLEADMCETKADSESADKWLYKMRKIQLKKASSNCDNNTAIAVVKEF